MVQIPVLGFCRENTKGVCSELIQYQPGHRDPEIGQNLTLFNSRGAVVGIPFIVLFSALMLPIPAWLAEIMPWSLLDDLAHASLALAVVQGQPLPSLIPIVATIGWCLLFTGAAIWKFRREDF